MTKNEVIKETYCRLYTARCCKPIGGRKTREEDWLESILKLLLDIPEGGEIYVDLDTLHNL